MIKITVLNDNTPGRRLLAEHGLSFLIETDDLKLLLDAGASDVFLRNANALNINLSDVDLVVLSHGHWDHGNGLKFLNGLKLMTHPAVFTKRYHLSRERDYVGLDQGQEELKRNFDLRLTKEPTFINDDVVFLGEIPRLNDFEAQTTAFVDDKGELDFVPDDTGIAVRTEKGLVVISGCAHAGICNTVAHASGIMNEERILAVMGGFHLKKNDRVTKKTIQYFKEIGVKYVYPSHCTDLPALSQFHLNFGMNRIKTGDVLKF